MTIPEASPFLTMESWDTDSRALKLTFGKKASQFSAHLVNDLAQT